MKNKSLIASTILIVNFIVLSFTSFAQNVGINTTGALPHNSALLDLSSSNKGFLLTRAEKSNITSPVFGLMTLSPSDSCLYVFSGTTWVCFGGAGQNCNLPLPPTPQCNIDNTPIVVVTSSTGKKWMDRNLGASQQATSSSDAAAFGDLYQWGRCSDGHEKRSSGSTATLSSSDIAGHGKFIKSTSDWRTPQNHSLWQGVAGINNPCPAGYRLPTYPEFNAERLSWGPLYQTAATAYGSALKLTVGGSRTLDGNIEYAGGTWGEGNYWTSTAHNAFEAIYLHLQTSVAQDTYGKRANGFSVRCIQN